MTRTRLFIRSARIDKVGAVFGAKSHSRPSFYGYYRGNTEHTEATTTRISLNSQDALALDLLRKSGIRFEVIDLSGGIRARLSARLRRIKETPTLLADDKPTKRYEGVKAISQYVAKTPVATRT